MVVGAMDAIMARYRSRLASFVFFFMQSENITLLMKRVLGKKKRRIKILLYWHSVKMEEPQLQRFIDYILHAPIHLSLHLDHFCLFEDQSFPINYAWLDEYERQLVLHLYEERATLFAFNQLTPRIFLSHCRVRGNHLLPILHRRELIRDLVSIACIKNEPFARNLFILLFQRIMVERKKSCDWCVFQFHYALQRGENVCDCVCCD